MVLIISNPLTGFFQQSFASSLTFAMWMFGFIAIALVSKKIEIENSKEFNPLRITLFASIILIIMLHILTMIPTIVNILSYDT